MTRGPIAPGDQSLSAKRLGEFETSARLAPLVETAQAYARASTSHSTNRAYAADWRDYLAGAPARAWRRGRSPIPKP